MGAFEDRLSCPFCRNQDLPSDPRLYRAWRIHRERHEVDKLEPRLEPLIFDGDGHETGPRLYPVTFEETFESIFAEALDLLVERQKKYGPENIRSLGLWGTFCRLADDKIERVRRAFRGTLNNGRLETWFSEDFEDESLEDALLDIANYALIMLALKRGVWGRPLREESE